MLFYVFGSVWWSRVPAGAADPVRAVPGASCTPVPPGNTLSRHGPTPAELQAPLVPVPTGAGLCRDSVSQPSTGTAPTPAPTPAAPAPQGLFLQRFLVKAAGCLEILQLTGCCGPHISAGQTSIFPLSPASSIPHTSLNRHRHAETSDRVVKVTGAVILKYLFHIHGGLSLAFIETQSRDQLSS